MARLPVFWARCICCVALLAAVLPAHAGIAVSDDAGHTVTLAVPARRIVSLAPHATELLFAAGAGQYVVGVIEHSDFPPQVKKLPSVGNSAALDIERIIMLQPDLVIAWGSGNSAVQLAKLRSLGIPVFESEPRDFATVASSLERLGRLAGTGLSGEKAATAFRTRLKNIAEKYQQRATVRVFYQIWRGPLMTLNDAHIVSQAIRICGGENIFGQLPQLAPTVSAEAVLQENPEAIVTTGSRRELTENWGNFRSMAAVVRDNLFALNGDLINRPGPRILDGTLELCKQLDIARSRRK